MTTWKLTPSQLTFGFKCPCCFYATVKHGWKKPYEPFPSVFGLIDKAQRSYWHNQHSLLFSPELPPGTLNTTEVWVKSEVINLPGHSDNFFISGKIDCLIHLEGGGYAVADFKTSQIDKLGTIYKEIYARQLHLYAWALERPADRSKLFTPIKQLGLMGYEPRYLLDGETLIFRRQWVEIERNDAWFLEFLSSVLSLLESDLQPNPTEDCDWCKIRQ